MSASSKKKLRSEEYAQKLTERQLQEQKEAKKLKIYTAIFVGVLVLFVLLAAILGITRGIEKSGIRERLTIAATVGDHKISNAELNYFYVDSVINYYDQISGYASIFGLDINKPLNEQMLDEESELTWADNFVDSAIADAKNVYAIADAAKAANFTLDEQTLTNIDNELMMAEFSAMYSAGYPSLNSYLKALYGSAANEDGYREYLQLKSLANAYVAKYAEDLTYGDADLREAEKENFNKYSSFTFNYKYLPVSSYQEGGTKGDDGVIVYTDDEKAAAQQKAQAIADSLVGEECVSVESFDALIAAMEGAAENDKSTAIVDTLYDSNTNPIPSVIKDWVTSTDRKAGDKTVIENSTTSTVDGKEVKTVNGYYAVYYVSTNDNNYALVNARHILVQPENGTYNSTTGYNDYTDEAWTAAETAANELYKQWQEGEKTEESFAALANENSDDGDGTTGGLYEDIYPGQMVAEFEAWCFDDARKAGDTGIVKTPHGYHIMYFSGNSETLFRDFMIENELRNADVTEWNAGLNEAITATTGNTKYLFKDMVLANYSAG